MRDEDLTLDGNAVAGLLQELFPLEMTTARTVCASCGAADRVGALRVYVNAPGCVIRCRACGGVQLCVVCGGGRYWFEMRGVSCVELDQPPG